MTTQEDTLDLGPPPIRWQRYGVAAGRIVLGVALILAWKLGSEVAGPLYVADPFRVLERIVTYTQSGAFLRHVYVTLRLSAIVFAIGCVCGVLLPFWLRRVPRLSNAVEPYIMASVGVPKYALV